MMTYDVIIAGSSFAGLAVASQLGGRILLIDPNAIGEHQTSACATPVSIPERLGLMDSVLRVQRKLVLHTRASTAVVDLSDDPYCTFDYKGFCRGMAANLSAEILKAHILGRENKEVITNQGRFTGEILVDASGWRAVLRGRRKGFWRRRRPMSFGIETAAATRDGAELGFWFDPSVLPRGFAWDFCVDRGSRIGLASYAGNHQLGEPLEVFLERWELPRAHTHGGYFPAALTEPIREDLFLVGDSAGQCLPLTGEGIRPAIYFGQACGLIIRQILDGRLTHEEGLRAYRGFVMKHQRIYRVLRLAQNLGVYLPAQLTTSLLLLACREVSLSFILCRYRAFADLQKLCLTDLRN